MLVLSLILLPVVLGSHDPECDAFCARQDLTWSKPGNPFYFCHPTLERSYVICHVDEIGGESVPCPENMAFSELWQTCVSLPYADCVSKYINTTEYSAKDFCEKHPPTLNGSPFICHPIDPHLFILCMPNTAMSEVFRCLDEMVFSEPLGKCVLSSKAVHGHDDGHSKVDMDGPAAGLGKVDMNGLDAGLMQHTTELSLTANTEDVTTETPAAGNLHQGYQQYTGFQSVAQLPQNTIDVSKPVVPAVKPARLPVPAGQCRSQYFMHPEKTDWFSANDICLSQGGHLAVIRTEAQQSLISSRYARNYDFWIGLNDIDREGEFRWVNGEGQGFGRWADKNPSSVYPNDQDCVTYNFCNKQRTKCWRGLWGDWDCSVSKPFLCETKVCRNLG